MSAVDAPGIEQRIRQVAIVLQSLDAGTAKSLLAQLPSDVTRQVKLAMVKLGNITPDERAKAMQDVQGLFGGDTGHHAGNHNGNLPPQGTQTKRVARQKTHNVDSPAAAILAMQSEFDQLEWSDEANASVAFSPMPQSDLDAIASETPWLAWAPDSLATLLAAERPAVIATVINQLSPERAKQLLDHLPVKIATETLVALPNLLLTDATILADILAEVEKKLPKSPPCQTTSSVAGIAKLSAIVNQFTGSQRQAWLSSIAMENQTVALQLGWTPDTQSAPVDQTSKVPTNATTGDSNGGGAPFGNGSILSGRIGIAAEVTPVHQGVNASAEADQPVILAMRDYGHVAQSSTSELHDQNRLSGTSTQSFERLLELSDGDFVTLLHSCDRQVVLRAIKNASPTVVSRVEGLIPKNDLKAFRNFLRRTAHVSEQETRSAQGVVLDQARRLMESRRIGSLTGFTFLAAA